jgi:N-acetylglutamate synthase-like GNAT family acetyltransferase
MNTKVEIRNALESEYSLIGQLMVRVYSQLEGFPKETEQPAYYTLLLNVGELTKKPGTELIIAINSYNQILGAVVNFSDMKYYGSGGTATQEENSGGFRLLAVENSARGKGIGKSLTLACIERAKKKNLNQVIIHSTKAMNTAWNMYEQIGFERSEDLDFMQGSLPVYGFRFKLESK